MSSSDRSQATRRSEIANGLAFRARAVRQFLRGRSRAGDGRWREAGQMLAADLSVRLRRAKRTQLTVIYTVMHFLVRTWKGVDAEHGYIV